MVALPIGLGLGSYLIVSKIDRSLNPFVDPEYRIAVESRVNEQQEEMLKTREYVRQHMDVLGSRIGSLQAQVSRIKAVEMRISEVSGINLNDFEFEQDPPIGGAQAVETDSEEVDIENAIEEIEKELAIRESEIAAVDFLLSRNTLESQQTPAGWPVEGGWISSNFGSRMHPMTGKKQFHRGVDIPGKLGAKIVAVADGVVTRSEKNGNYGWMVEVDHGDSYTTLYGHNRKNLVKTGETVVKGQEIAEIGSTGRSTGPHVHFEVAKSNQNINPVKYLYKKS
ncbi:peptidase M23-like protein [Arenicella xantha]|uniref:Peptidase M23-like protein n=2 Tax=Arenicella xantha TaxID=644221 RepID=A0A395JP79_9GAMM|nr:peptidase M23-like protein [Arenicella xantha]